MPASAWQSSAQKNISWIFESTPTALIWRGVDAHTIQPTLWPVPRRKLWYVWAEERSRFDSFLLRVPRRGVVMNEPRVRANNKKYPFKFFFHALRKVKEVIRWACTRWFACVDIQSKVITSLLSKAQQPHGICLNARSWIRFDQPRFCCTYRTIKETKRRPSNAEDGTRLWPAMVDGHELAVYE